MSSGLKQSRIDRIQNWFVDLRNPSFKKAMQRLEEEGLIKSGIDEFGKRVCWLTEKSLIEAKKRKGEASSP